MTPSMSSGRGPGGPPDPQGKPSSTRPATCVVTETSSGARQFEQRCANIRVGFIPAVGMCERATHRLAAGEVIWPGRGRRGPGDFAPGALMVPFAAELGARGVPLAGSCPRGSRTCASETGPSTRGSMTTRGAPRCSRASREVGSFHGSSSGVRTTAPFGLDCATRTRVASRAPAIFHDRMPVLPRTVPAAVRRPRVGRPLDGRARPGGGAQGGSPGLGLPAAAAG